MLWKRKMEAISGNRNVIFFSPSPCTDCTLQYNIKRALQMYRLLCSHLLMQTFIHTHTPAASFFFFPLPTDKNILSRCRLENQTVCAPCEWLSAAHGMIIPEYSVFIYPHRSARYNSPDECSLGKLKAIESNATWCLILVMGQTDALLLLPINHLRSDCKTSL